jgi:putative FmdB family regulatory protein
MPIYRFECNECKQEFESISKPFEPGQCPKCLTVNCTKLISSHSNYEIKGDNSASTRPKGDE